jgi:hypothetical protein
VGIKEKRNHSREEERKNQEGFNDKSSTPKP